MLPLDLHVLGLPPAFTLSQDQTLHLKLRGSEEPNVLSAELVPGTNYSLAFLHLNLCCSVTNVCILDTSSTCQTSAQVTCAHCQRSAGSASAPHPFFAPPRRTKVPEGAAHHTAIFRAVNTFKHPFLPPPPLPVQPLGASRSAGRALCTSEIGFGRGQSKNIY